MIIQEFITPTLLQSISRKELRRLLEPMRERLMTEGLWPEEKPEGETQESFSISHLVRFLWDAEMPKPVEDAFLVISALTKDEYAEDVGALWLELGDGHECDNYEMSVSLWFLDPQRCRRIISKQEAMRTRRYNYHRPAGPIKAPLRFLNPEQEALVQKQLSGWFDRHHKSPHVWILPYEDENLLYYSILHGATRKRQTTVTANGRDSITFRPEIGDMVRIDKKTGVISVYLRFPSPKVESHYVGVFGRLLMPGIGHLPDNRYTLEPLYRIDRALSRGAFRQSIFSFRLKKVQLLWRNQQLWCEGHNLPCLWETIPMREARFKKAEFEVIFTTSKQPHTLTIAPPCSIEYPELADDGSLDGLLEANGFLIKHTSEEADVGETRSLELTI